MATDYEWIEGSRPKLVIGRGKKAAGYTVVEHQVGRDYGHGRGFLLRKLWGGSDGESIAYDVFIDPTPNGRKNSCNCRGFERFGHCKHHDAIADCIARRCFKADRRESGSQADRDEPPVDSPTSSDWRSQSISDRPLHASASPR
jgi:hypothetical protein